MTTQPSRRRPGRRQGVAAHPHGWSRATDGRREVLGPTEVVRRHRSAPAGTSILLALIVGVLAAMGIIRVRATTQILEYGAQITELTEEHARLQEQKRRLGAERAYLRHPAQILETSRDRLGLVPIAPELVQQIRLVEPSPAPEQP